MKKILIISLSLLPLAWGCRKEALKDELAATPAVLTLYDTNIDFGSYASFHIPDSIGVVSDDASQPKHQGGSDAQQITSKIRGILTSRGYSHVGKNVAELGVNVTIIHQLTDVYSSYNAGYWWGYDGYWGGAYWGYATSPYYYGYYYDYTYESGSLLIEMVDLKNAASNNKLKIIWNAEIGDIYAANIDVVSSLKYVQEAFDQSAYLKKN